MPLEHGDSWRGLDRLKVIDESTGEVVSEGAFLVDMDINPEENVVTMIINSDVG